jgi:hypothetical protein
MSASRQFTITVSNTKGVAGKVDPCEAGLPVGAGYFHGFQPFGYFKGIHGGHTNEEALKPVNWVKTLDSGTVTLAAGNPPALVLTTAATANTGPQCQMSSDNGTTAWARFNGTQAGFPLYGSFRFALDNATTTGMFIGFAEVNTTILSAASNITGLANGFGFYKAPGSTVLTFVVRNGNATTFNLNVGKNGAVVNLANATFVDVEMRVENSGVRVWINGVDTGLSVTLPNVNMCESIALDTTTAAARTLTVRRASAFQEIA